MRVRLHVCFQGQQSLALGLSFYLKFTGLSVKLFYQLILPVNSPSEYLLHSKASFELDSLSLFISYPINIRMSYTPLVRQCFVTSTAIQKFLRSKKITSIIVLEDRLRTPQLKRSENKIHKFVLYKCFALKILKINC